jgi:hypothetical protein
MKARVTHCCGSRVWGQFISPRRLQASSFELGHMRLGLLTIFQAGFAYAPPEGRDGPSRPVAAAS